MEVVASGFDMCVLMDISILGSSGMNMMRKIDHACPYPERMDLKTMKGNYLVMEIEFAAIKVTNYSMPLVEVLIFDCFAFCVCVCVCVCGFFFSFFLYCCCSWRPLKCWTFKRMLERMKALGALICIGLHDAFALHVFVKYKLSSSFCGLGTESSIDVCFSLTNFSATSFSFHSTRSITSTSLLPRSWLPSGLSLDLCDPRNSSSAPLSRTWRCGDPWHPPNYITISTSASERSCKWA